ncbi:MAG: hypothetical protein ACW99G_13245 [Candidatus Thorarchaeota archaeon]|jgi:hypothetical protein
MQINELIIEYLPLIIVGVIIIVSYMAWFCIAGSGEEKEVKKKKKKKKSKYPDFEMDLGRGRY